MKTFLKSGFSLIALAASAFTLFSCGNGGGELTPGAILKVSSADAIAFTAAADESENKTVTVTTNVSSGWDAKSDQAWCVVTKDMEENAFTVSAKPNTSIDAPPAARITVSAKGATSIIIEVKQSGAGPTLWVSPSDPILFPGLVNPVDAVTVTVTTDQDSWEVSSDQTWCTASKTGADTFLIYAESNLSPDAVSPPATVTVTAGLATPVTISVTQKQYVLLKLTPRIYVLSFNKNWTTPDPTTFLVTTSQPSWDVTSSQPWCVATKDAEACTFTVIPEPSAWNDVKDGVLTVTAGEADPLYIDFDYWPD